MNIEMKDMEIIPLQEEKKQTISFGWNEGHKKTIEF